MSNVNNNIIQYTPSLYQYKTQSTTEAKNLTISSAIHKKHLQSELSDISKLNLRSLIEL